MNSAMRSSSFGMRAPLLDAEEARDVGSVRRVSELRHRLRLDLTNALAGEFEDLADLFQRARLATVQPEPQRQDPTFARTEPCEELLDLVRQHRQRSRLVRRRRATVLHAIAELPV